MGCRAWNKEALERWKSLGFFLNLKPEEAIRDTANAIICGLYYYDAEAGQFKVNGELVYKYGLAHESINWGDLKCTRVEYDKQRNIYIVYVDEAKSQVLELWLEEQLIKFGWRIRVICDW